MVTEPSKATRAEDVRDLRREISGIEQEDNREIIFKETSPQRRKVTVYSMTNGEPVQIPVYMLDNVLAKVQPNGESMFTARQERAPEYKLGTTLCFLHADGAERAVLNEIGLGGVICPKGTLANKHSKRMHALHRHQQEWAAYQEHMEDQKEARRENREDKQLEATLALARGAAGGQAPEEQPADMAASVQGGAPDPANGECDFPGCGRTGLKNVGAHKRGAHNQ